jgi:quinoprotein glucose dehydrogenase
MCSSPRTACVGLVIALLAVLHLPVAAQPTSAGGVNHTPLNTDWPSFGNDRSNTRYAPLDQINAANFKDLEIAWRWESISSQVTAERPKVRPGEFKAVPVVVDGVVYLSTAVGQAVALDAGSGELRWVYDPESYAVGRPANLGWQHRGVAYWNGGGSDPRAARIFLASHDRKLHALDPRSGEPVAGFGVDGVVDLLPGDGTPHFGRRVNWRHLTHSSPPVVVGNTVIVGSIVHDGAIRQKAPPGFVRGFDARTGALEWVFHTIAQPGEEGAETWQDGSNLYTGAANVWTMMAVDEKRGYVYLPISTPTNDFYGGHRKGDNLYAESIVCLDADSGKKVWHFQAVHHGLWDYDFPTPPNLIDITVDGRRIEALAQVSKQAFTYVLDRATGEPVWPIEERPVPASTIPGEQASPTQPFPTKPPAFDRQGFGTADLNDLTPELHREARAIAERYVLGPIFTPPSLPTDEKLGAVFLPGSGGGANWPGAAVDPETGWLYVPSRTAPGFYPMSQPDPARSDLAYTGSFLAGIAGPQGLPLVKPPWSRVTAIDLNQGEIRWSTPNGWGPVDHPALRGVDTGMLGGGYGAPLLTKTLLFVTQPQGTGEKNTARINVFHKQTGELLGHIPLPRTANANPVTYMHNGRQYIVVAVGGGPFFAALDSMPDLDPELAKVLAAQEGKGTTPELVALALPEPRELPEAN